MTYYHAYTIYYLSLLFASICSIYEFKILDYASKVLAILVCCALVNESAAYYLSRKYHSDIGLYNIYCLVEFGILSYYFNETIDAFKKNNIGIFIGIGGILLGICNLIFIQHTGNLNSYFLFFEGFCIIGICLFAFSRLLLTNDDLALHQYHHFWFLSFLIFFWSVTFLYWGIYPYINMKFQNAAKTVNIALPLIGTITYGGVGIVFLLYKKMMRTR